MRTLKRLFDWLIAELAAKPPSKSSYQSAEQEMLERIRLVRQDGIDARRAIEKRAIDRINEGNGTDHDYSRLGLTEGYIAAIRQLDPSFCATPHAEEDSVTPTVEASSIDEPITPVMEPDDASTQRRDFGLDM